MEVEAMQMSPTQSLMEFLAGTSFQKFPGLSAFLQLVKGPKPGRRTLPPCPLGRRCPPLRASGYGEAMGQPGSLFLGCLQTALRDEPSTLSPLCLRASGCRPCPELGPEDLSSRAQRSWGPRSKAWAGDWLPCRHCPLTFVHWPEPVRTAPGPVPTLPCHSLSPQAGDLGPPQPRRVPARAWLMGSLGSPSAILHCRGEAPKPGSAPG